MSLLSVEGARVRFGGLVALDDVSVGVAERAIVGLIGPNGSGKTTLFNTVSGFVEPQAGRVVYDGRDITRWPAHRRASAGIGRTFQRLEVFRHLTVLENLMVAHEVRFSRATLADDVLALARSRTEERVAAARAGDVLDLLGIGWARDRLAGELPLGVGRIVELGRALVTRPRLVLLDEPSSGLSPGETAELGVLTRRVRDEEGLTVFVVEHDMSLVMGLCEHIWVLDFGRVIASGSATDVRDDPEVRAAYLGVEDVAAAGAKPAGKRRGRRSKGGNGDASAP
jgi:branched-chain amino acid transport system ATP-binding protein